MLLARSRQGGGRSGPFAGEVLDAVEDVFFVFTADGEMLQWNQRAREVTGYTGEELAQMHPTQLVPAEEAGRVERQVEKTLQKGRYRIQAHLQAKDGRRVAYEFTSSLVEWEGERLICDIGRDVSERKEAFQALRALEEQHRSLLESAPDAIVIAKGSGEIVGWNPAAQAIFGYEREEIRGRGSEVILPERHRPAHREWRRQVHRTGEGPILGETTELKGRRKDGEEFPMEVSLSSWEAGGERYIGAIIRDVTGRRRLQQELLRIQEEERMRIGHDLHDGIASQLTGITFRLESLARCAGKMEGQTRESTLSSRIRQVRALVQETVEEVRRLSHGLSPAQIGEEGLPAALRQLVENTQEHTGISCEIHTGVDEADGKEGRAKVDLEERLAHLDEETASHLYRIAQEAIQNAVKHAEATTLEVRLTAPRQGLVLAVTDDGKGIPRAEERSEGLGLRAMRHRAELVGSRLDIERPPEGGTRVRCRLDVPA